MKYSVLTTNRELFSTNSKKEAKNFAYLASRDLAPSTGNSANNSDLDGSIVVYNNEESEEVAIYNFTKIAIKAIQNNSY